MIPSSHQLSLKLIQKCPACRAPIPPARIHILEETDSNLFAHLSCPHCMVNYLTYIVNHPQGLVGNAIMTDLTYDETLRHLKSDPIDENKFLELHLFLQQKNYLATIHLSLPLNRKERSYE